MLETKKRIGNLTIPTTKEVEIHVNKTLNTNVLFVCNEVLIRRHMGNKRLRKFRMDFTWTVGKTKYSFARCHKVEDVESFIDGYVKEVNNISSNHQKTGLLGQE